MTAALAVVHDENAAATAAGDRLAAAELGPIASLRFPAGTTTISARIGTGFEAATRKNVTVGRIAVAASQTEGPSRPHGRSAGDCFVLTRTAEIDPSAAVRGTPNLPNGQGQLSAFGFPEAAARNLPDWRDEKSPHRGVVGRGAPDGGGIGLV